MKKDLLTNRERFKRIMNFETVDRMPMYEWAPYWDLTLKRWMNEGLDTSFSINGEIGESLGLDLLSQTYMDAKSENFPYPKCHGDPVISTTDEYIKLKKYLYPDNLISKVKPLLENCIPRHKTGDMVSWFTYDGFFWHPRNLFGIENHFYAFYDEPELMHLINQDLTDYILKHLDALFKIQTPDYISFMEDMSYNHGPMLSKDQFDEFIMPYYKKLLPEFKKRGIKVFVDSDGDVTEMISWFIEAGFDGLLPLERQAGVDVLELKKIHPEFLFIGAYDKLVMKSGEEAMRIEFERLLPAMKMGGFISSVDHQTPPDVSLENYQLYVKLLREYAEKIGGIDFK